MFRDVAAWILGCVSAERAGVHIVTGRSMPIGEFFAACQAAAGSDVEGVWVDTGTLLKEGVEPFMGVPLWNGAPEFAAAERIDISRALAAGLTLRPPAETLADTAAWDAARGVPGKEGLTPAEEERLLTAR